MGIVHMHVKLILLNTLVRTTSLLKKVLFVHLGNAVKSWLSLIICNVRIFHHEFFSKLNIVHFTEGCDAISGLAGQSEMVGHDLIWRLPK